MDIPSQLYFDRNLPHHYYSSNLPEFRSQPEMHVSAAERCRSLQHKTCPAGVGFAAGLIQKIEELINDASPLVSDYAYTVSFKEGEMNYCELLTVSTYLLTMGFSVTLDRWHDSWARNTAESDGYKMIISWVNPSNIHFKETETTY